MKTKLIALMTAAVILMATAIPAAAADFVSSAEDQVTPTLTILTTQVGDYVINEYDMYVISMYDDFSNESFADEFQAAIDSVFAVDDIEDLVGSTGMFEPAVACIYYLYISDGLREALYSNTDVVLDIMLSNVGIDGDVSVLGYVYKSDEWGSISTVNNGDNSLTISGTFCPFMTVVETGTGGTVESPATSVNTYNVFAIIAVISLFAAGGFFIMSKRAKKA